MLISKKKSAMQLNVRNEVGSEISKDGSITMFAVAYWAIFFGGGGGGGRAVRRGVNTKHDGLHVHSF